MSRFLESLDLVSSSVFRDQSLIVVGTEDGVDGSFVLHSLLAEFGRLVDGKVLLLLNHQTTNHWAAISAKLGWNLQQMKERGQLAVIDILKATYEFLMCSSTKDVNLLINPETHRLNLIQLYEECVREVAKLCPPNQNSQSERSTVLIIIEDLSNILHTATGNADNTRNVLEFLRKLRFIRPDVDVCVGTLVNSSAAGTRFSNLLTQVLPSLVFHMKPLKTGFSSKFNGVLGVRRQERVYQIESRPLTKLQLREYHYKREDRGVKFFPL